MRLRQLVNTMMILTTISLAAPGLTAPVKPAAAVKAVLELGQQFYYVGEALNMRVTITNNGSAEVANPVKSPIFGSFTVTDGAGKRLEPQGKAEAQEPSRPAKLGSRAFYGAVVDLSQLYPQLKSKGRFTIRWAADGVESDQIVVTVIPKFDPSKAYSARVQTEEGEFVIDLAKPTAPIATKAFVDLANAGFYDGLLLHEVRPDQLVSGGDPTGLGGGQAPLRYPAELAAIPVVAGTVVLKPAGLSPPANSSQFIIALAPEPKWTGQFTVLGQVTSGLEVVRKISNLPSGDRPNYRPVKDIHTIHVTIVEK